MKSPGKFPGFSLLTQQPVKQIITQVKERYQEHGSRRY